MFEKIYEMKNGKIGEYQPILDNEEFKRDLARFQEMDRIETEMMLSELRNTTFFVEFLLSDNYDEESLDLEKIADLMKKGDMKLSTFKEYEETYLPIFTDIESMVQFTNEEVDDNYETIPTVIPIPTREIAELLLNDTSIDYIIINPDTDEEVDFSVDLFIDNAFEDSLEEMLSGENNFTASLIEKLGEDKFNNLINVTEILNDFLDELLEEGDDEAISFLGLSIGSLLFGTPLEKDETFYVGSETPIFENPSKGESYFITRPFLVSNNFNKNKKFKYFYKLNFKKGTIITPLKKMFPEADEDDLMISPNIVMDFVSKKKHTYTFDCTVTDDEINVMNHFGLSDEDLDIDEFGSELSFYLYEFGKKFEKDRDVYLRTETSILKDISEDGTVEFASPLFATLEDKNKDLKYLNVIHIPKYTIYDNMVDIFDEENDESKIVLAPFISLTLASHKKNTYYWDLEQDMI